MSASVAPPVPGSASDPLVRDARAREVAARLEAVAARLLTVGTRVAMALTLLGVAAMIAAGIDPITAPAPGFSLAAIPAELLALGPTGLLWAGLLVLVALPLGRVVVSGAGFLAAGDRRLALVALLVLLVIATSIVAALRLEG